MKAIRVWRFEDAPASLRKLSDNGGDEDWLALVPPGYCDDPDGMGPLWLESPAFGCGHINRHDVKGRPGWAVYVGCHA